MHRIESFVFQSIIVLIIVLFGVIMLYGIKVPPENVKYVDRVMDFLFVLASPAVLASKLQKSLKGDSLNED